MPTKNDRIATRISVDEAEHNLPTYLHRAEAGEAFVILEAGKPIAEIKPPLSSPASQRPYGLCAGEFRVPDDFDAPLPENVLAAMEGR